MTRLLTKDFLAGLLFVAFGAAFLWLGSDLRLGTPRSMGPGFVPRLLSIALMGIGGFVALRALIARAEPVELHNPRPLLLVIASVALFTFAFERFGLVPAATGLIVLAAWARPDWRRVETLATVAVLLAIAIAIFKEGLGMTFPVLRGVW
ncbi:MAG: tripartite tricarboxylate transporter TctB family protein [Reyranellaceae bacterium]